MFEITASFECSQFPFLQVNRVHLSRRSPLKKYDSPTRARRNTLVSAPSIFDEAINILRISSRDTCSSLRRALLRAQVVSALLRGKEMNGGNGIEST